MAVEDKILGGTFMAIAVAAFSYYTMWTLVTVMTPSTSSNLPFIDANHPIQAYFPDRYWAVAVPLLLLAVAVSGITSMLALVMVKSKKPKSTSSTAEKKTN